MKLSSQWKEAIELRNSAPNRRNGKDYFIQFPMEGGDRIKEFSSE
jgi:hypothetical protein